MSTTQTVDVKDALNRSMPAAKRAMLGDAIDELITKHNALLAKLDADAGVTGTDYVATLSVTKLGDR